MTKICNLNDWKRLSQQVEVDVRKAAACFRGGDGFRLGLGAALEGFFCRKGMHSKLSSEALKKFKLHEVLGVLPGHLPGAVSSPVRRGRRDRV